MNETKKMTPEEFRAKFREMIQKMKEKAVENKKTENVANAEALKEILNKLKRDE